MESTGIPGRVGVKAPQEVEQVPTPSLDLRFFQRYTGIQ